jgi:hypothetical protein
MICTTLSPEYVRHLFQDPAKQGVTRLPSMSVVETPRWNLANGKERLAAALDLACMHEYISAQAY